jgi:hypothetical protein
MDHLIAWIAAQAEPPETGPADGFKRRTGELEEKVTSRTLPARQLPAEQLPSHQFPTKGVEGMNESVAQALEEQKRAGADAYDSDRERRIYRGRTVTMLRRYMRYSIETGRLPSVLGMEFFRAKVTSYRVTTFEDRVIFVHDMERCLERLDEFSRQLIARHILQEHDQAATGKLLHCTERTVRSYIPVVLDLLSEILVEVGLMERLDSSKKKSCQEGENGQIAASGWEKGKYKF